jgi:hypothetical protein
MKRPFVAALVALVLLVLWSPAANADEGRRWGGFVEADLGVLAMSGGVGLFAGPSYGPFRFGAGFYRFDSPWRALSGAPAGFELKVNYLVAADASWFFASERVEGPYVRALVHFKGQRVENTDNGARRDLFSALAGPEVGWAFRIRSGVYLAPRVGALYYLEKPQGVRNAPIDVGGSPYDNDHHKTFDLYATLGLGVAF